MASTGSISPVHRAAALLAVLLAVPTGSPWASAAEPGLPLVTSSRARDLAGDVGHPGPAMLGFGQDSNGLLYVANEAGVLVFDGSRWQTLPVGGAAALSLAVAGDDTVFVGASNGYGVLRSDAWGRLRYDAFGQLTGEW